MENPTILVAAAYIEGCMVCPAALWHRARIDFAPPHGSPGCPGITTLDYQRDAHAIAMFPAKRKFLGHVLVMEIQDRLTEIARHHFGDKI